MFERFTDAARAIVVEAQGHARRLGHSYIGCEHLLLAAAGKDEPAGAVLREWGVTPEAVEKEIVRLAGARDAATLFSRLDREALASIGIDLDQVQAKIEARFGAGALTRDLSSRPGRRRGLLRAVPPRRRRRSAPGGVPARAGRPTAGGGHIPFTPRAKKCLALSLREARTLGDNYLGTEHLTLALAGMKDGAVPPILSALGAPPAAVRAAILDRYRKAS